MSDKTLLIIPILCLAFGGYKLIQSQLNKPEPTEQHADTAETPPTNSLATAAPPQTPPPAPPQVQSAEEQIDSPPKPGPFPTASYKLGGIAKGQHGYMVMINNTPLNEGDTLGELTVEKIADYSIEVSYKGHTYQLTP